MKELPPIRRLAQSLWLLTVVAVAGAVGFRVLDNARWLDGFYYAVTTLVGFRDSHPASPALKVFTMAYIITGIVVVGMAFSNLLALLLEGDLKGYFLERRMQKRLNALKDHIIVCGFGKTGFQAAWELKQVGVPFVLIEKDESKSHNARFEGELFLVGNAMDEVLLERAGITRARGLITTLQTDADNVLVTLTARQMNPNLSIVARSTKLGTENKLKAAGADHIVSPYEIGGRRMASLLLTPDLLNYVDVILDKKQMEMAIEHILVRPESYLVGKTMREVRLRDRTGALIVGINRPMEGLRFNPTGSEVFEAGDVLLAMGDHEALDALVKVSRGV
ncbi:potassium channel family protein [Mesoterricola silvestris]|uniref:Potassium channel protein n=1 Tax=Mesoterricola silvestris TaxID=2927979 RepID=A0AA48GN10_9BACT|nr:potassium channel protein [Mesoterricola silvestris]BDU74412.1 potassium channel protein [Mesoterricola silvestris]